MLKNHILIGILVGLIGVVSAFGGEVLNGPQISFLDKAQAAVAIVDDSKEPYFGKLQLMEMSAKTGSAIEGENIAAQRMQCRERYQAAVLEFEDEERATIRFYIEKFAPILSKKYPLMGAMPWSFLKVADQIEGGLPHTRDRHIILSESMCESLVAIQKLPSEHPAHFNIMDLLLHEQVHVFQRMNPGHFDSLYRDVWGFEKASSIAGCAWLVEHQLVNPDAAECPWVLPIQEGDVTSYLWPLVIFSEGDGLKAMPADFRMVAIAVKKAGDGFVVETAEDEKPVYQALSFVPVFNEIFPLTSSLYHPDEAAADLFAQLVIFDGYMPQMNLEAIEKSKLFAPLRNWCKANLR